MNKTYKSYEPETLRRLQKVQTEILRDFISLCDKYDLDYFMLGGSGIGTVRHQGFIPWDDDIDVAMPRRHYEVLINAVEQEMGDKYQILTPLKDERYACNVTHMQKKGTKFVPEASRNLKCDLCIDIDIFPMDHLPEDKKARKRQLRKTWFLSKLLYLCGTPDPILPLEGWKRPFAAAICRLTHYGLKLLKVSPKTIYEKLLAEETRYNHERSRYLCPLEVTMADHAYISKQEMYPLRRMAFEGLEVYMPNQYDTYLKRLFGDYMTLPPREKRVNHCPYLLDFGDGKKEETGNREPCGE
ncbi:MAG: LicD family protein [Blautia sp.]